MTRSDDLGAAGTQCAHFVMLVLQCSILSLQNNVMSITQPGGWVSDKTVSEGELLPNFF